MNLIKGYCMIILLFIILNTPTNLYKNNYINQETIWKQDYKINSSNISIISILQTQDNGFIVMGRNNEMAGSNYVLIKTDNYGREKWSKIWGGDFHIYCIGECVFEIDNMIYLVGQKKAIPGAQKPTIWLEIFKLDNNGNILLSNSSKSNSEKGIEPIYLLNNEAFIITEKYITKMSQNSINILKIPRNESVLFSTDNETI